jgi:hypothetical protein
LRSFRAAALSALLASWLGAGCYKPNIKPGALICASNNACPDGFRCLTDRNPHLCFPNSYDAGATGGNAGQGGEGGAAGAGTGGTPGTGGGGGVDAACLPPVAPCNPSDAGACDPVCNIGCGQCFQKCSVDTVGDLTCNALSSSGPPVGILQLCAQSQSSSDKTTQSDNCQPGSACVAHNVCGQRCYQFCRSNADCQQTGATCSIDAGGGQKYCDVPTVACDPVNGLSSSMPPYSKCPLPGGCYLSADSGNTLCDCYSNNGPRGVGDTCTRSRDCYPGLVCIDPTSNSGKHCYKVCRLPSGDGGADLTRPDAGEIGCSDYHHCMPILLTNNTTASVFGFCNE